MSSVALRDRLAHLSAVAPQDPGNSIEPVTSAYRMEPLESVEIAANRHAVFEDDFFAKIETLNQKVNEIENHVRHVEHLHGELLLKAVAPESQRKELDEQMVEVSTLSRQVQSSIQSMGKRLEQFVERDNGNDTDQRMHKLQYNSLIQRFNGIMDQYQQEQTTYRVRCKERIKRQLRIVGKDKSDFEIDEMLNVNNPNIFIDEFSGGKIQQTRQALDEIEQRHKDILQLEDNMRELQEMFDELARIIDEQGEIIDRIDLHVERTRDYVHKGAVELHKAVIYTKKSKKKLYIIICIIVAVVIAIVIGVVITIAIVAGVVGTLT